MCPNNPSLTKRLPRGSASKPNRFSNPPASAVAAGLLRERRPARSPPMRSQLALEDAGLKAEDVDYLLFGTMTPDRFIPGSSPAVQKALGLREIPCLDIRATCCNALYALQVARALVTSGTARRVAICLAEIQSAFLDLSPAAGTTSMLFGDGASALIVSNEKTEGALEIMDIHLATDGTYIDDLGLRCPGTEFGTTRSHDDERARGRLCGADGRAICDFASLAQDRRRVPDSLAAQQSSSDGRALDGSASGERESCWRRSRAVLSFRQIRAALSLCWKITATRLRPRWESRSTRCAVRDAFRRASVLLLPAFGAGFTWGAGLCVA